MRAGLPPAAPLPLGAGPFRVRRILPAPPDPAVRTTLLLAFAVALCGCFETVSVLTVRPDGSATLRDHVTLSGMALLALRDEAGEDELFSDESFELRAQAMGPGVRLAGVERTDDGYVATYEVDDVRSVRLAPAELPDLGESDDAPFLSDGSELQFRLSEADGLSTLRILVPKDTPSKPAPSLSDDEDELPDAAEMMEMMGAFFEGARVRLAVRVEGTVEETNATYVDGSEVTLIDLPFEAMLSYLAENPDQMDVGQQDSAAMMDALDQIDGVQIQRPGTVRVRFR